MKATKHIKQGEALTSAQATVASTSPKKMEGMITTPGQSVTRGEVRISGPDLLFAINRDQERRKIHLRASRNE